MISAVPLTWLLLSILPSAQSEQPNVALHGALVCTASQDCASLRKNVVVEVAQPSLTRVARIENGEYRVTGLQPGECVVTARGPFIRPYRETLVLDAGENAHDVAIVANSKRIVLVDLAGRPLDARSGGENRTLAFPWGKIRPIVTTRPPPEELGLIDDRVSLYRCWSGLSLGSSALGTETLDGGSFREVLQAGEDLAVTSDEVLYVSAVFAGHVLATVRIAAADPSVLLPISTQIVDGLHGSVRLRLVDAATRQPIAGARICVGGVRTTFFSSDAEPDAEGNAVVAGVVPGVQMLYVDAPDHEEVHRLIVVEPGTQLDLGTIALAPPHVIEGTLSDADGHVVLGDVWCRRLDDFTFPQLVDPEWRIPTDERGRFRIGDRMFASMSGSSSPVGPLGAGTYLLYHQAKGRADWAVNPVTVSLADAATEQVAVKLTPGHAATVAASGELELGLYLVTITMAGIPVWSTVAWDDTPATIHLRSGDYELTVTKGRKVVDREKFTIADRDVSIGWTCPGP